MLETGLRHQDFVKTLRLLSSQYAAAPLPLPTLLDKAKYLEMQDGAAFRQTLKSLAKGQYSQPIGWVQAVEYLYCRNLLRFEDSCAADLSPLVTDRWDSNRPRAAWSSKWGGHKQPRGSREKDLGDGPFVVKSCSMSGCSAAGALVVGGLVFVVGREIATGPGTSCGEGALGFLVAVLGAGIAGMFKHIWENVFTEHQIKRNQEAEDILENLRTGHLPEQRSFVLFLRSHVMDGRMEAIDPGGPGGLPVQSIRHSLEMWLTNLISPVYGPLIGLRNPSREITLGASTVDVQLGEWKDTVKLLMSRARFIVAMPAGGEGMLWELEQLKRRRHLAKTVFVMPSVSMFAGYTGQENVGEVSADWQEARRDAKGISLELPEYDEGGAFFVLDERGQLLDSETEELIDDEQARRSLERLLTATGGARPKMHLVGSKEPLEAGCEDNAVSSRHSRRQ